MWLVACADDPASPGGVGKGGTTNGGSANGGTANGGTTNGGSANGGTTNGGTANGGTTNGGSANGGSAGNVGGAGGAGGDALGGAGGSQDGVGGAQQGGSGGDNQGGASGATATCESGGGAGGGTDGNLFEGSGFETNTLEGWYARGSGVSTTLVNDGLVAHSGCYSVEVTGRTDTWQGLEHNVISLLTPGITYSMTAWVRLAEGSGAQTLRTTLELKCDGSATSYPWIKNLSGVAEATWTELTGTLSIPGDCTPTKAVVYVEGPPAGIEFFVDDVSLTEQ